MTLQRSTALTESFFQEKLLSLYINQISEQNYRSIIWYIKIWAGIQSWGNYNLTSEQSIYVLPRCFICKNENDTELFCRHNWVMRHFAFCHEAGMCVNKQNLYQLRSWKNHAVHCSVGLEKGCVCVFAHIHTCVPKSSLIYTAACIHSGAHPNTAGIYKTNSHSSIQVDS